MAILGNFTRLGTFGARLNGGGAVALCRGALSTGKPALWRNALTRDGATNLVRKEGLPHGYYPPGAWRLPVEAGAMTAVGAGLVEIQASAAEIAEGRAIVATDSWDIALSIADGGLVVGGIGADTWSIDAAGEIGGVVTGLADDSFAIALSSPTPGGISWGVGDAAFAIEPAGDLMGIGWMVADESPTELTAQAIAQAVGERVIEAGFSADQILRLLAAHAAGAAVDLEGANPRFYGLDGVTLRIDGAYSGGTRTIDALTGTDVIGRWLGRWAGQWFGAGESDPTAIPGRIIGADVWRIDAAGFLRDGNQQAGTIGGRPGRGHGDDELERLVREKWDAIEAAREAKVAGTQRAPGGAGPAPDPAERIKTQAEGASPVRPVAPVPEPALALAAHPAARGDPARPVASKHSDTDEALAALLIVLVDEV